MRISDWSSDVCSSDLFNAIPGAEIIVKEFENGPPIEAPIALRVIGPDLDTLRDIAARVETLMQATPGVRNIGNPLRRSRVDLQLDIDTAKAGLLGVPVLDLDRAVRLAVAGLSAEIGRAHVCT